MRLALERATINAVDTGHGTPVIFLHGRGGSWRDWDPQLEALRDTYRCIATDHRGHGSSAPIGSPITIADLARDVVDVMDALEVATAHVVGLSLGGFVAQQLSVSAPDRIRSLILVNTVASMTFLDRALADAGKVMYDLPLGPEYAELTKLGVGRGFSQHTHHERPWLVERMVHEVLSVDPSTFRHLHDAIVGHDLADQLEAVAVPTLVVVGCSDTMAPPDETRKLCQAIPHAELVELDAAHVANQDAPAAFTDALRRWLADHDPTS